MNFREFYLTPVDFLAVITIVGIPFLLIAIDKSSAELYIITMCVVLLGLMLIRWAEDRRKR